MTGEIVDNVRGPIADLTVLKESKLVEQLHPGVGALGNVAYADIYDLHSQSLATFL